MNPHETLPTDSQEPAHSGDLGDQSTYYNGSKNHRPGRSDRPGKSGRAGRNAGRRRWPLVVIIVAVVLGLAAGAYWYFAMRNQPAQTASTKVSNTATSSATTPADSATPAANSTTAVGFTNYVSTQQNLNLSFDYPDGWAVSPKQTTASATTPITISSPSATIPSADGASVTGKVVISIRPGGGQISELVGATAAQDSMQIAYDHPTASQHQYPYLTFVHFMAGTKTEGAFEEVIVSGIQQLKKGDVVNSDSLGTIDPLISASFYTCATADCPIPASGGGTLGVTNATWQGTKPFLQTAAVFSSFKLN